jgi:hypothetical protein
MTEAKYITWECFQSWRHCEASMSNLCHNRVSQGTHTIQFRHLSQIKSKVLLVYSI